MVRLAVVYSVTTSVCTIFMPGTRSANERWLSSSAASYSTPLSLSASPTVPPVVFITLTLPIERTATGKLLAIDTLVPSAISWFPSAESSSPLFTRTFCALRKADMLMPSSGSFTT